MATISEANSSYAAPVNINQAYIDGLAAGEDIEITSGGFAYTDSDITANAADQFIRANAGGLYWLKGTSDTPLTIADFNSFMGWEGTVLAEWVNATFQTGAAAKLRMVKGGVIALQDCNITYSGTANYPISWTEGGRLIAKRCVFTNTAAHVGNILELSPKDGFLYLEDCDYTRPNAGAGSTAYFIYGGDYSDIHLAGLVRWRGRTADALVEVDPTNLAHVRSGDTDADEIHLTRWKKLTTTVDDGTDNVSGASVRLEQANLGTQPDTYDKTLPWGFPQIAFGPYQGILTNSTATGSANGYIMGIKDIVRMYNDGAFKLYWWAVSIETPGGAYDDITLNAQYTPTVSKAGYVTSRSIPIWLDADATATISLTTIPTISGESISDYSITADQAITITCTVAGSPTVVGIRFVQSSDSETVDIILPNTTGTTYATTIYGDAVGVGTWTSTFYSSADTTGDTATDSNLVVANPSAAYATNIKNAINAVKTLLEDSTRTVLAAIDDDHIQKGQPLKKFQFPRVFIDINKDTITDYSVSRLQSELELMILVFIRRRQDADAVDAILDLAGDVHDELMVNANRQVTNAAKMTNVSEIEYGISVDNPQIRAGYMTVMLKVQHVVG